MKKNERGFSIVELLIVIVIVVIISGVGWFLYKHKSNSVNTTSSSAVTSNVPLTDSNKTMFSKLGLNVVYIKSTTVQSGFAKYDAGHQLSVTSTGTVSNLSYDGITVARNQTSNLVGNPVLSQNGLHYAYAKTINSTLYIYVDDKQVGSFPISNTATFNSYVSNGNYYLAVSNNGKDYAYQLGNNIIKDGQTIYTASKGQNLVNHPYFNSDLTSYIAQQSYLPTPSTSSSSVVINGSVVATGINDGGMGGSSSSLPLAISENGAHTFYVDYLSNKFSLDNQDIAIPSSMNYSSNPNSYGIASVSVANNGGYGFINSDKFDINGKVYPMLQLTPPTSSTYATSTIQLSQVNSKLHYLIWSYVSHNGANKIDIDGNLVTLQKNNISKVELYGNTLYIYYL